MREPVSAPLEISEVSFQLGNADKKRDKVEDQGVKNPPKVDDPHSLAKTIGSPVLFLRTKCLPEIPGALHRPEGEAGRPQPRHAEHYRRRR